VIDAQRSAPPYGDPGFDQPPLIQKRSRVIHRCTARLLVLLGLDPLTAAYFLLALLLWLLLGLFSGGQGIAACILSALIPAQICLSTIWATWSPERLAIRLSNWAWRLTVTYFLILVMGAISGPPRHTADLWFFPMLMAVIAFAAWLSSGIFWLFRWRIVMRETDRTIAPAQNQFRLSDIWRWMTQICALLAVMTLFKDEVVGWAGLGYVIVAYLILLESVPVGLLVTLVFWLALGEHWTQPKKITASLLLGAWTSLSALTLFFLFAKVETGLGWLWAWGIADICILATVVAAYFLRKRGWVLIRQPKKTSAARVVSVSGAA
jgi:hypothetical protein